MRAFFMGCNFIVASQLLGMPSVEDVSLQGACDASAAIFIKNGTSSFLVVGEDEHNALGVYANGSLRPNQVLSLDSFLGNKEVDIEGGTKVGNYQIWIGSHSRKKDGRAALERHVLFATELSGAALRPVGSPYRKLIEDFIASPLMGEFDLASAVTFPPEHELGLNIEGVASDGQTLKIALRGPTYAGKGLIVTVGNPLAMIQYGQRATVTRIDLVDLNGRGIRDITYNSNAGDYLLIAGPVDDSEGFSLYRWREGLVTRKIYDFERNFRPEGVWLREQVVGGSIGLLSDDGSYEQTNGIPCRKLPLAERHFRVRYLDLF